MSEPSLAGIDFGVHAARPATPDKLQELTGLVRELEQAELEVAEAEQILALKKERLRGLVEHKIPELMLELKQPVLHTSDGRMIVVKDVVRATLPEANRPKGFAWLLKNGHGGLIKRTVEVAFAAAKGKEAEALLATLGKEFGANARETMKVEPQTLLSFIKKQLVREDEDGYNGEKLPTDVFEVREFKHAEIKSKG
jgi:hypothetical protein